MMKTTITLGGGIVLKENGVLIGSAEIGEGIEI